VPPSPFQKNPNVEWTQVGLVSYQQFAEYFQEQIFDICIAPLRDNLFNHSKSSIKFLEYSALGIPGVYSRITPYKGVIEEGVNGFLATSLAEWEEHLVRLIENEELRTAMGASAQESVARDWLLSNHAQEWQSVYSQISHSYHSLESTPASTYQPASVSDILRQAVHWQARLIEELIQQDETIHQLKQQLSKMSVELTGKEQAYQTAQSLYLDIMNSSSWKLMQKLIRFRLKVLPKNSRREKLVRLMFFSLQVIRREGLKAFLRGLWRRTSAALKGDRSPSAASQFQLSPAPTVTKFLHDGNKIPLPAISILTILETGKTQEPAIPDEFSLTTWCQNQTLGIEFLETATWDQTTRQAWFNQRPDQKWEAQNLLQAVKGLHGRYLCIASDDLIQQHPTYLEENLIALESEKLAFTINLNGKVSWAINQVGVNDLPGKPDDFLRQIVAIQCIQENGAWVEPEPGMNIHHLDFSTWFSGRSGIPNIVGKIIHHTTNADDLPELLPFESHLPDMEWQLVNQHLLAIPAGQATSGEPIRPAAILHPLGSFLPAQPVTDKRPTILLVQQYLAVGGAEQLALHIMEGLKDRIRFVVISIDPMDPSQGTLADSFRLLTPYVYNLPDFIEKELYLSFFEYVIERFSPATLYIANGAAAIYDLLGSIKRKYPRLRTVNQVYDNQVGWINRYAIDLITYLDAHIGANERICQAYLDKGARPGSVFQIEHAVDLRHLDPSQYTEIHKAEIRLRLGLSPAKAPAPPPRCVTFAARLNPQKRPLDFVELARRFSNDPSVEFLMVGDGPLSQTVDYQIERIGLKNIRRHRFYRPISDILAITDVLVLPSEYEGMPLIVSETLGMGKPVVVTDVGNNRYVVELTGGGYIVSKIGDISELEAGLRQVFASPPDGKLLRQIIQENFSVEVISNRYLDVLLGKNHER
jgi:glycosyltransferase involved in cell wall biosynthesis